MEKNKKLGDRGITLIALIVTIIVLLILAGVSIAVLTGENGILNRATSAKETHEEKTEEEKLKLGVLALSTEYRSQTTHSSDEDKFSKFVNKEANKTKLANELGVSASAIEIDTAKDILTYRTKQYKLDSYGGIADYTPPAKITLTLVKDENNDGIKNEGDEVKVGEQHFYVIKKDGTTMTLLSKYNLATNANATTGKYEQTQGSCNSTKFRFSNSNYWSSDWVHGSRIDLNNWETTYNKTMPSGENSTNNAILRARQYAIDVFGNNAGAKGRLLTYEEAKEGLDTCLFGGTGQPSTTVLYGRWTDTAEKVESDGCLHYWLASSYEDGNNGVLIVRGNIRILDYNLYNYSDVYGVRPVIEVPESAIQ